MLRRRDYAVERGDDAPSRRSFLGGAAATMALSQFSGCAGHDLAAYDRVNAARRGPGVAEPEFDALVRAATLAPSGHNTQPWHFALRGDRVQISADLSRRTPMVDPDDHHLFVSLGCAAENLLIAAEALGRPGSLAIGGGAQPRIEIDLGHGVGQTSELYRAIALRQSTRSVFDGRAVPGEVLKALEAAARVEGVSLVLITDAPRREAVLEQLLQANTAQMGEPAFVAELRDWVRFNEAQAMATGDGLFSVCSGQTALPTWLGKRLFSRFFTKDAENAKYVKQMRSSAGVAVFVGDKADADHWIRVGRSLQRFALQATALGVRYAMVNQPVEVVAVRAGFAQWLGAGGERPDLVLRFGLAPPMPMSLRRPVRDVMDGPMAQG